MSDRTILPLLGALLDYPSPATLAAFDRAAAALAAHPATAAALRESRAALAARPFSAWEELYTRTFDLAPACAPYASVHALGEESWQRAELMVGLAAAFRRVGFDPGSELPDHLGVLLRAAPSLAADEWGDLSRLCIQPAAQSMRAALEELQSPYAAVLGAVCTILAEADGAGVSRRCARPSASAGPAVPNRGITPACRHDFQEDSRA